MPIGVLRPPTPALMKVPADYASGGGPLPPVPPTLPAAPAPRKPASVPKG